jgi:hypothetical protein
MLRQQGYFILIVEERKKIFPLVMPHKIIQFLVSEKISFGGLNAVCICW